jgi:hypothetical protein
MHLNRTKISVFIIMSILLLGLIASTAQVNLWARSVIAAPSGSPHLSIKSNIPADPNSKVVVPVRFTSNGSNISSIVFSIDYDETWLRFDNSLPNAIVYTLPNGFGGSCTPDTDDTDGEIDCVILPSTVPLPVLPDGVIIKVKLLTKSPTTPVSARVGFSANSPPTSFGDNLGQSVPGTTKDGSVQIGPGIAPVGTPWAYLPAIFRNLFVSPTAPPSVTPTSTFTPTPSGTPGVCENLIINSDFENEKGWEIPVTMYTAGYSKNQAHSGVQSMRTGIDPPTTNVFSYSSARQLVTLPDNGTSAKLRLWIYPISGEKSLANQSPQLTLGEPFGTEYFSWDFQYILVLDQYNNLIQVLDNQLYDSESWEFREFDLSNYIGSYPIKIEFGTYNNGSGDVSAMYVDDVTLEVCK